MSSTDIDDTFNAPPPPRVKPPTRDDILGSLRWRKTEEVKTSKGPRLKTVAIANGYAHELFKREGPSLYKLGYTLTQWPRVTGPWFVTKWELVPQHIIVQRELAKDMSRATSHDADLPRPPGMEYFPFQKAGIAFSLTRRATLFADEPGLGKTCQAIGVINCIPEIKRILVICPASLKLNWRRELERWLVRKRTIFIADSKVFPELLDAVIIINYDVIAKHRDAIRDTEWDYLICDEAHYLKNPDAKRTQVVFGYRFKKKEGLTDLPPVTAKFKALLTGTPICNRPKELYPLINFLDPINWSSWWKYAARYCDAGAHNAFNCDGASNLEELQDRLRSSIMIRRLKRDVLTELPPKTRRVVEFAPTGEMLELAKEERAQFSSEEEYQSHVDSLLTKPIVGQRATYRKRCAIAKVQMPAVLSYLDDAVEESGKVIVFCWHVEVYTLLRAHFGPRAVGMNGSTPQQDRQVAVDSFQHSPAIQVIVGNIITMGTGHTLTAASRVIMVELDDVPGNVTQAEDRAHRIGQRDNVLVEHLIVTGTIDAHMARNIVAKQEVIDAALDKQSHA